MKTKLVFALTLLTATPLFAVVDQNNNSLSDVDEFIYFGGPTDPFADPDGALIHPLVTGGTAQSQRPQRNPLLCG